MAVATTELVPASGGVDRGDDQDGTRLLEQIEQFEAVLPGVIAEGRSDDLFALGKRAEIQQLYEKQRGYADAANRLGRLKVKCEAAIGMIDILENPSRDLTSSNDARVYDANFVIDGVPIKAPLRQVWRSLAISYDRQTLDAAFGELEAENEDITTHRVYAQARRRGDFRVPNSAFAEKVKVETQRRVGKHGTGTNAVAQAVGVSNMTIRKIRQGEHTTSWWLAKRLAAHLDIDLTTLPGALQRRPKTTSSHRWVKRQRKLTGGRWDECYSRFRLFLDEFQRVAPTNNPRYSEAYEHARALEEAIGRRMMRESGMLDSPNQSATPKPQSAGPAKPRRSSPKLQPDRHSRMAERDGVQP